jgi:hypothetical protein
MDPDILHIDHGDHSWLPFYLTMWLHKIGGSHSDSYHVVVEVLGFGRYLQVNADVSKKHAVSIFRG